MGVVAWGLNEWERNLTQKFVCKMLKSIKNEKVSKRINQQTLVVGI
jgi:hypothetical protein